MLSLSVISPVEIRKLFYEYKLCTLSMPEHDWLSRKLPHFTSYILPQLSLIVRIAGGYNPDKHLECF